MIPSIFAAIGPQVFRDNPAFDFTRDGDGPTLIAKADAYGPRVVIDILRTESGNYRLDTLYQLANTLNGLSTLQSIPELAQRLMDRGKTVTVSMGGIHKNDNEAAWQGRIRRGNADDYLWRGPIGGPRVGMNLFDEFRGDPQFRICLDGSGIASETIAWVVLTLSQGGHEVEVEGCAPPHSLLAGRRSITTATAAVNSGAWFDEEDPDSTLSETMRKRAVYFSNEDSTVNTPANAAKWRGQGRDLLVSASYLLGEWPGWLGAA